MMMTVLLKGPSTNMSTAATALVTMEIPALLGKIPLSV